MSKKVDKGRKAPDTRPARARYWISGRLAERKIRALVLSGMTPLAAVDYWKEARKRKQGHISARIERTAERWAAKRARRALASASQT